MTDYARLFKQQIDQQTFDRLAEQVRLRWLEPPQPFQSTDLEPFYRELDRQVWTLSRHGKVKVPYHLLTNRPRPRLQDRLWARMMTARRLLFRAFRR